MESINKKLESLMVGVNYVAEFGFINLGAAYSFVDLKLLISGQLPDLKGNLDSLVEINKSKLWFDIQAAFDFRGDYGAGMKLNDSEELALSEVQADYKVRLKSYIDISVKFYEYTSNEGLPLYPVFWGYCFVFGNYSNWQLIYGVSSD